jgi:hypothetical protein
MEMSYQRVNPLQRSSVHQRCCIDRSDRAGESLAFRLGKNLKKSWTRQRIKLKSGENSKNDKGHPQ